MEPESQRVLVRVYDLTRGMATALAPAIIGQHVEGIWHSGVVVFGKEWFFGGGIQSVDAGAFASMYQLGPSRTIDMGITEVPAEVFKMWIDDQGDRFTAAKYNLVQNNCNHFADAVVQFLTGQSIPSDITTQANELVSRLLASPMAGSILPLLQGMGGGLVPNLDIGLPQATPATPQSTAAAPPEPKQDVKAMEPRESLPTGHTSSGSGSGGGGGPSASPVSHGADHSGGMLQSKLRSLGNNAAPYLSLEGHAAGAVAKLGPVSEALAAPARWTDEELSAVNEHLPHLVSSSSRGPEAAARGPGATGGTLTPGEAAAVAALTRAARDWPLGKLSRVSFVARPLLVDQAFQDSEHAMDLVTALGDRVLAPGTAATLPSKMMATAAVTNFLASRDAVSRVLERPALADHVIDGTLAMLTADDSTADARTVAAALLFNFVMHPSVHVAAHDERVTAILCAAIEGLSSPRGQPEVERRLLRIIGQLLAYGGEAKRDLALALGLDSSHVERTLSAVPQAGDDGIRADLLLLLSDSDGALAHDGVDAEPVYA